MDLWEVNPRDSGPKLAEKRVEEKGERFERGENIFFD